MNNLLKQSWVRWPLIAAGVLFLLSLSKDLIIKTAIELTAPGIVGAKLHMGSFSLGLLNQRIHIKNFELYNPPGFEDKVMVAIPEMMLQVNVGQLMQGKMYFPDVIFNMEQMTVIKDKQGKLNVESLKIIKEQQEANKGKPAKLPVFKIDELHLSLGRVIMQDNTHAPPTLVQVYEVHIKDKTIKNINGLPKLVGIVMLEALKPTAIRSAGLMAATSLMGVAFFPAVAVGVALATDDVKAQLSFSKERVFQESSKLIKELNGTIKTSDEKIGKISAKVYGCDVWIETQDLGWGKSSILIKVRKYMLAKPEIAAGLLYQLNQRL